MEYNIRGHSLCLVSKVLPHLPYYAFSLEESLTPPFLLLHQCLLLSQILLYAVLELTVSSLMPLYAPLNLFALILFLLDLCQQMLNLVDFPFECIVLVLLIDAHEEEVHVALVDAEGLALVYVHQ